MDKNEQNKYERQSQEARRHPIQPCKALLPAIMALWVLMTTAIASSAQTVTTLVNFDGSNGASPNGPLVQGTNGNFYGTTLLGGSQSYGTAFRMTPAGALATIYNFCVQPNCTDGNNPEAGLVLATNGDFYGTTTGGGNATPPEGTVFRITPQGARSTLYSFINTYAYATDPSALIQATNGDFYGMTQGTGTGYGMIYKVTPSGEFTSLYSFTGGIDGGYPVSGLVQASNGGLYAASSGISIGSPPGEFFVISLGGAFKGLRSIVYGDGEVVNTLVQATDGSFYGTAQQGGSASDCGLSFGCGTFFKMTSAGKPTLLYSFCSQPNCTDGVFPYGALVQGTDGNFYGTTQYGGNGSNSLCISAGGCGTIFKVTPTGTLTTLYSFNYTDGNRPNGLVQGTDGDFYGTTQYGGLTYNGGTAFSLSVGLGPFVETLPTSGKVGAAVRVLGSDLTGSSGVSFNGVPATFTVVSPSEITATVPTGATTGTVLVNTPGSALSSNVPFRVP